MNVLRLRAAYTLGFYHKSIFSTAKLILGDFGLSESHTEMLHALSPLKGAIRRLMKEDESKILLRKLDKVYDYVVKLKLGKHKNHQHGDSIFYTIQDLSKEVEEAVSEFKEANLSGRALCLFESGRLLWAWYDLLEPPCQLSKEAFESLILNLGAAGLSKAAEKAKKIHDSVAEDYWHHSEVFSLHNEILRYLGHEAIQEFQNAGQEPISRSKLTGLPDLEQFNKDSEQLFENPNAPVSFAFADLDDLKRLNSDVGHDAADEVIQQIALILENSLEYRAKVYHRSGDEFLLVFENTNLEEAELVLERALRIVRNHEFDISDKKVKVTMSAGISTFPDHTDNIEELKKYANEAMQLAKSQGKSCIRVFKK